MIGNTTNLKAIKMETTKVQKTSSETLKNSNSSAKYNDHYNKLQLLERKNEGIRIEANADLLATVHRLHELLGAMGSVPEHENKKQQTALRHQYYNDWLRFVLIENERAPAVIPLGYSLSEFANGLVSGNIERKGNNVAAFAESFNRFVPKLMTKWRIKNGEEVKPKSPESEWDKICKGSKLERWPDEILKDQYDKYLNLFGGNENELVGLRKLTRGYFGRIEKELQQRKLI